MNGKKFNKLAKVSKSRKMGKVMVDEDVMGQDPLKGYPFQKKFSVEQSFRNMVETSNLSLSEDDDGGRTDGLDKSPSEMTPKQRQAKADHDKAKRDRDARKKAYVAQMQKDKAHSKTPAEIERKKKEREQNLKTYGANSDRETHRQRMQRTGGTQTNSFDPQLESNEFNTYRNMIDMWTEENLNEEMITYRVKKMQKPEEQKFNRSAKMMGLKITMNKGKDDTVIVMSGTKKKLRDFDAVARGKSSYGDPSTIKHFDEGAFYGRDDLVKQFKTPKSQRKANVRLVKNDSKGFSRATLNIKKDAKKIAQMKKDGYKVDPTYYTEETVSENYRKLAKHGMGTETPKSIKVGTEIDYYQKDGAKYMGKVTKMSKQSYTVKDDKTKKSHEFFYHDRVKAQKLLKQGDNVQEDKRDAFISTILEKAYDENDVKKVQQLEKKLQGMLKEVDKTMKGSGLSAPAFNNVRSGIQKGLESIQKFYKIAKK